MFRFCRTKEEIKQLYRDLSKFLHPDKHGDHDLFIRLTHAYEFSLDDIEGKTPKPEKKVSGMKSGDIIFDIDCSLSDDFFIVRDIFAFAKNNKKFSLDFVNSVLEFGKKNGYITSHQYNSLLKVHASFRMDKEDFTDEELDEAWSSIRSG